MNQFAEVFGPDRPAAVAREMTKKFEEIRRGTVGELAAFLEEKSRVRGEIVLVVAGTGVTMELWG
jgi:16S rRNA (cytidine1402-2'-O)-methyltransferase